jgi:DNA-binding IclR family transcriptional regulator
MSRLLGFIRSIIEMMVRISNDTVALSQTLDRGLACLEHVAASDTPVSVDAVAAALGLHRSIVYRLLRTLERRRLIERDSDGDYTPGPFLAVLSRSVRRSLRAAAAPVLARLAEDLQMTAFLVVADGDEAVTIDSVEPTSLNAHVAYRPGTRHPIDRGAPGIALLAGQPAAARERAEVTRARTVGWAQSEAEVIAGMASIAVPIADEGAIAVLWLAGNPVDTAAVADVLVAAATDVRRRLGLDAS